MIDKEYLISLVGKTVKFTKNAEDWEAYPEEGMQAIVVKWQFDDRLNDPVHKLWFDFFPFEEENHKRQNSNFYDKNGQPTLTAVEAGWYHPIDDFYIDGEEKLLPFEVVN